MGYLKSVLLFWSLGFVVLKGRGTIDTFTFFGSSKRLGTQSLELVTAIVPK